MKDFVSCFSENSVNVSNSSCSKYSSNACISQTTSLKTAITCVYKVILSSTQKQLFIRLTWSTNQGLTINFDDHDPSSCFKLNTNSRFKFGKKKGNKATESHHSKIHIFWDLSTAKYDSGPEPFDGYYIVVVIDSEVGLVLGHLCEQTTVANKFKNMAKVAKSSLISRQEHCSGNTQYSTKAQFIETGIVHDVSIRCSSGQHQGLMNHPVLSVCIDKKTVIRVKRLQWNFRGNQTIFIDGLLVDMMWDVHDWFFKPDAGSAVFMFRARSGLDSRLWLEEKLLLQKEDDDRVEFSLLIYACKNT